MSALPQTTVDRMRVALAARMDEDVAGRQRLRISEELRLVPVPATVRASSRPGLIARVAGLVAVVVLVVVAGSGVASQAAIPGDLLYPVKRLTEPLLAAFNDDLAASHRVDELGAIIVDPDRADRIDRAIIDAQDAVDALAGDHPLRSELDRIVDRTASRPSNDVVPNDAGRDHAPPRDNDDGADDRRDGGQSHDDADTSSDASAEGRLADPGDDEATPTTTAPQQGDPPPSDRASDESPPDDGHSERGDSADSDSSTGEDEPPADRER